MKYWSIYIACVNRNCAGSGNKVKYLFHWRNSLFTTTIIYLLPFCFIALLPHLYWIVAKGLLIPAIADVLAGTGIAIAAFMPRIILIVRKMVFTCSVYLLSGALLYYLGLHGTALVYVVAACIFTILLFQNAYTLLLTSITIIICFCFGIVKLLDTITGSHQPNHLLGSAGMVVCSNLVLLSFCFLLAALIHRLFNMLQETIAKEKKLQKELNKHQQPLQPILDRLQQKNNKEEQFTVCDSNNVTEFVFLRSTPLYRIAKTT